MSIIYTGTYGYPTQCSFSQRKMTFFRIVLLFICVLHVSYAIDDVYTKKSYKNYKLYEVRGLSENLVKFMKSIDKQVSYRSIFLFNIVQRFTFDSDIFTRLPQRSAIFRVYVLFVFFGESCSQNELIEFDN